jgi:hypothetical protein
MQDEEMLNEEVEPECEYDHGMEHSQEESQEDAQSECKLEILEEENINIINEFEHEVQCIMVVLVSLLVHTSYLAHIFRKLDLESDLKRFYLTQMHRYILMIHYLALSSKPYILFTRLCLTLIFPHQPKPEYMLLFLAYYLNPITFLHSPHHNK